MLVPVTGNYDPRDVNRFEIPPLPKALAEQRPDRFPPVYLFNVGPHRHELPPSEKGFRYIEACPVGAKHSVPLIMRNIEMELFNPADGAGKLARLEEDGLDKARALIHVGAELSLYTPNLEWQGVFVTENETPTAKELADAKKKLQRYMRLVYDEGSRLKSRGHVFPTDSRDPELFNEAAAYLGQAPLFGVDEHTRGRCLFCGESIVEGVLLCKHCGSRQDSEEAKKLKAAKATA